MQSRQNIQFAGHPSFENELSKGQSNVEGSETSSLFFCSKYFQVDADPVSRLAQTTTASCAYSKLGVMTDSLHLSQNFEFCERKNSQSRTTSQSMNLMV
jgi:hypothetical protein